MNLDFYSNIFSNNKYNIFINENYIYIDNYIKVITLKDDFISIELDNFYLNVNLDGLFIKKLVDNEIIIYGILRSLSVEYK